jgi:cyclic pyranopterin phosphate synthase
MAEFSHLDDNGDIRMVDVTAKSGTVRTARAAGRIRMRPETVAAIYDGNLPKGNVLTTAKVAGIQAAKRAADIIPLCHPLQLTWIDVRFSRGEDAIEIEARVTARDATGVEMEALTAVSAAALTVYDMCKAVDKDMVIDAIRLEEKTGGKSDYRCKNSDD